MNLSKILPNSTKTEINESGDELLYIILVEWGWDYETYLETPIPIIMRTLKVHNSIKKAELRAHKKKK
jgi:hypothetical protein